MLVSAVAALLLPGTAFGGTAYVTSAARPGWAPQCLDYTLHFDGGSEVNKLTVAPLPTGQERFDPGISFGGPADCDNYRGDHVLLNDPGAAIATPPSDDPFGFSCSRVVFATMALCPALPAIVNLGGGNDRLFLEIGGATVYGGAGDDQLRTVNLVADDVHCGEGSDVVTIADPFDRIDADCERVVIG